MDIAHAEAKLNHMSGSPALVERALRSPHVGCSLGNALVEALLGEVNLCGPEDISAATRRHLACCSHACFASAFVDLGLQTHLIGLSPKRKRAQSAFVRFVKNTSYEHKLQELVKHDAPRFLGDASAFW